MDLEILNQLSSDQLLAAATAVGFAVGALLMLMLRGGSGNTRDREDPRNHTIRSLEADLRAAQREINDLRAEMEDNSAEFKMSVATLQELRVTMSERDDEIETLKDDLKDSVRKTRELRVELQDRAAQSVREHVRAEEATTEAEVARAGSEAVMSEIARLEQEREQLSKAVHDMGDSLLPEAELYSEE